MNASIVITVLAVWQVIILVNQLPLRRLNQTLMRLPVRLFPRWEMFLGPQTHLALFYRDRDDQGEIEKWTEIPTALPDHRFGFFWYPEWDHFWCLRRTMIRLMRFHEGFKKCVGGTESTTHYRALKHFVQRRPAGANAATRQFRIDRSFGHIGAEQIRQVYCSDFFDL